ncbi:MAG TPA: hypothetical protein VGF01_05680 [Terracidiphilus sp.]
MRGLTPVILSLFGVLTSTASAQTSQTIPAETARAYFAEAQALCQADHGKLWGISLCGPMIFAEPKSHFSVANQTDANGFLKPLDGVFSGILPVGINITNSPFEWSGVLWTMMVWPLPAEAGQRKTLMAHELFHRIQPQLNLPKPQKGENAQIDTLDGRYTLQLELRALSRALRATSDEERKKAAADAILFRAERHRLFPDAAAQEEAMEWNEGLAEFTGIRIGNPTQGQRIDETLGDISRLGEASTFVRSFPYATGPAYGLLLDRYVPGWYRKLKIGDGYDTLLAAALHFHLPADLHQAAERQAASYGGVALRATEVEIDKKRQQILAQNRAKFVDGPTLTLSFRKMRVQFDPRTLQPLEGAGTVYGKMRISDEWGILEASSGVLMKTDWSAVIVVAPAVSEGSSLKGDGWTLELKPGWKIAPGARKGDYILISGS